MQLLHRKIRSCTNCPLYRTRTHAIPGEGPVPSRVFLIAQSPGRTEDQGNAMFIGPSGPIFDRLIRHAGLNREDFYMSNLIKCMLPKSRRPAREEIGQCSQYLLQEFRLVHPSVLVPLGFHSTRFIFKEFNIAFPPKNEVHALFGQLLETPLYWIYPLRHPTALLFNPEKLDVMQKNYAMLFMLLKDDRYA